jgi:seryl-tRNA(Sec) selenium transferase
MPVHASKAQKRSKNWSVVDAANGAVIFTLVRFNTDSNGWFSKYETQLVNAQGNIVARIQDKVMYCTVRFCYAQVI